MQHEYHRCPVTALAFWSRDVLLAGEGNYLKAYHVQTRNLLHAIQVFDDQAIHGILVTGNCELALVWGGRHIHVFAISDGRTDIRFRSNGDVYSTDDWILDIAFSPSDENGSCLAGLITAHNALWCLRIKDRSDDFDGQRDSKVDLERAITGSNCILYSAHIRWLSASHCLIASGTAFGDVVLWSTFFEEGKAATSQVHFTYSAHEGSVFGVQMSPMLKLPGQAKEKRILATCSDDRTVRLWDISDLSVDSPTFAQLQRDTGFGARSDVDAHAPPRLAKVMGHTSRVWHVRFLPDAISRPETQARLLSCGEDAAATMWHLQPGSSDLPFELARIESRSSHAGKNIWSTAQHHSGTIATGGADSTIALLLVMSPSFGDVFEIPRSPFQGEGSNGKDSYKAYAFVSNNALISTTDHGRVVLLDPRKEGTRVIMPVNQLLNPMPGLRGYSVVTSFDNTAFISGSDGAMWCYVHPKASVNSNANAVTKFAQRTGKTAGLFASRLNHEALYLLATGVGTLSASLYTLTQGPTSDAVQETHLALPDGCIVTSFAMCQVGVADCALVGLRTGSLHVYITDNSSDGSTPRSPSHTRTLLHGKEAVTAVLVEHRSEHGAIVFSTGRDGILSVQRLAIDNSGNPSLQLVHQLSLPLGPNIEGLCITPTDRRLLVWGFRGKHFVQYDATAQEEMMSVECGGAHRNWSFRPDSDASGGTFVWTKASKVYRYSQTQRRHSLLTSGGHGREIKAIAISSAFEDWASKQIIATGAEDTDIKLFCLDQPGFRCLQTLRKHNTGIQHLAWDGEYLFSSGGFEEFFVWRVTHDVPYFEIGVVCESTHPKSGKSDLRICGFDVSRESGSEEDAAVFEIWMGYSDSSFKLWRYSSRDASWVLLRSGEYLTACLTHVFRTTQTGAKIVTAATDGHLALWHWERSDEEGPASLTWCTRHRVHQSAIHALTYVKLADGSVLVATGGDDNAIALARIADGNNVKTLLIPRAHAAAVTGLVILPAASNDVQQFDLVSACIAQRIKLWRVSVDVGHTGIEGVEVELKQSVFTAVADVSGLDVCSLGKQGASVKGVVVSGVGLDVWRLPGEQDAAETGR